MATQKDNWEAIKALFEAALEEDSAPVKRLLPTKSA